jgi:hypothetical protein|tara:strand:- start:311 stop:484 length:174 start_codon:yes stop_codon:yes gene_type:complete
MDILEEALKVERDELEKQRIAIARQLVSAQERLEATEDRWWKVTGLIGQMRKGETHA